MLSSGYRKIYFVGSDVFQGFFKLDVQQLQKLLIDAEAHTSIIYAMKEPSMINSDFNKLPVHAIKLMLTDLVKLINCNEEASAKIEPMFCEPSTSSKQK